MVNRFLVDRSKVVRQQTSRRLSPCGASAIQHEEFPERVRTTGLSAMNLSTEVIFAISYFVSATFINQLSVQVAWGISAVCFSVAVLTGIAIRSSR